MLIYFIMLKNGNFLPDTITIDPATILRLYFNLIAEDSESLFKVFSFVVH